MVTIGSACRLQACTGCTVHIKPIAIFINPAYSCVHYHRMEMSSFSTGGQQRVLWTSLTPVQ